MIPHLSERALILAPHGRDASVAASMLKEAGVRSGICASLPELLRELEAGAGFAIVAEEGLKTADLRPMSGWLHDQPEWSDFPFVLLTGRGGGLERNPSAQRFLDALGNVTFLERPFHPTTLISLAQSALRGRRRQYEARARLLDLHRVADQYRNLFDSIDAGFCIIEMVFDADNHPVDYIFVETNPAFARQTGLSVVAGQSMRALVPGHEQRWFDVYGQVALTGERLRFEDHAEALGDIWYEVYAFRVGEPTARQVAILFNDVSERRKMENALRHSEEGLRRLNETLEERVEARTLELNQAQDALRQSLKLESMGQLTGGVAHDFNNLLTPIVGSLDLLSRRGLGTDRERRLIQGAVQSADRAKTLVQRLLAFARRQPLQAMAVDMGGLVKGMAELIASTCGPRVKLDVEISEDLPPALADPNQVEMALLNLSVNARDAMQDGGVLSIGVTSGQVESDEAASIQPGDYIVLTVTDTGVGMDAETAAKAIEPFFTTKGVGQGTGLGLSMVHGLAAQLGGSLSIRSAPGEGTTIELLLPVSQVARAEISKPAKGDSTNYVGRGTALVVDDEDLVRASTADMLGDLGFDVVEARSAEEALSLMTESLEFDVLITDHMMPGLSGTELVRHVRQIHPSMRVLVISGYADIQGISPDLPRLSKPFKQVDLAASLAQL